MPLSLRMSFYARTGQIYVRNSKGEKMKALTRFVFPMVLVFSLLLSACGGATTQAPATEAPATEAPATSAATEAPATEAGATSAPATEVAGGTAE
jgi:hypothetical protein